MKPQPLTDAELDRLSGVLKRFGDKRGMNLEQLDGFLCALICCPDLVPPSEYLPKIWGGDIILEDEFSAQPLLNDFLSLGSGLIDYSRKMTTAAMQIADMNV